jgi:Protein of unknown function (DUF2934)
MDQSLENRIRERAYEIWTAHGCVHGQADQHWLAAEREILAASTPTLAREPAPKKKRRSPARSKAVWETPGSQQGRLRGLEAGAGAETA